MGGGGSRTEPSPFYLLRDWDDEIRYHLPPGDRATGRGAQSLETPRAARPAAPSSGAEPFVSLNRGLCSSRTAYAILGKLKYIKTS